MTILDAMRDAKLFGPWFHAATFDAWRTILKAIFGLEMECGGSFDELEGRGRLRCSWHHDRGDAICSSQLMVRRTAMEERVLGAIQAHVLEPDTVLYVVERALAIVEQEVAADVDHEALEADRRRLAEIEEEAARAARLMVKGGIAESTAEELLTELEVERSTLEQRIARADGVAPGFDREVLRPLVGDYARDLGKVFDGSGAAGNRALRALLGERRIGVYADEERGFRLEGESFRKRQHPGGSQTAPAFASPQGQAWTQGEDPVAETLVL